MVVRIHRGQCGSAASTVRSSSAAAFPRSRLPASQATMDGLAVPSHGLKLLSGTANRASRGGDRAAPRRRALSRESRAVRRRRDLRAHRRERPRQRRVHRPADESARREHHGAAAPDRRRAAGVGGAHHLRDAVLRLRAAGPQGPAARADRRQADGEHDHRGGRRPRARRRFPPAPAAGVLRRSGRSPVRDAGVHGALSQEAARTTRSSSRRTSARRRWRAGSRSG